MSAVTQTGNLPIGIRPPEEWAQHPTRVIEFAASHDLSSIDVVQSTDRASADRIIAGGFGVGAIDLPSTTFACLDDTRRVANLEANLARIREFADFECRTFLAVIQYDQTELQPYQAMSQAVDGMLVLSDALAQIGGRLAVEGCPGPSTLVCNPEGFSALFEHLPEHVGITLDASHLVWMGIEVDRFLDDFGHRVFHVHAKDAEIDPEWLYRYGLYMRPIFGRGVSFAGPYWRYRLVGRGKLKWPEVLKRLVAVGYTGVVSIEVEDNDFRDDSGLQFGYQLSRDHLQSC